MNSYASIEEARNAAATKPEAIAIIEIEPALGAGRYILGRCPATVLAAALKRQPIPEIRRVIRQAADLRAERAAAANAIRAEREARLFPGLAELRAARAAEERYAQQFASMMSDDGAWPPARPIGPRCADLAAQYPAAAAYLRAEGFASARHDAKAAAGQRAMRAMEAGEAAVEALARMESEWRDAAIAAAERD